MSADQLAIAAVRAVNAVLWVLLAIDLWRHAAIPLPVISRRLVIVVIVAGMGILLFGAFAPMYLDGGIVRVIYTIYTGFAAMAALAILKTWRLGDLADGAPLRAQCPACGKQVALFMSWTGTRMEPYRILAEHQSNGQHTITPMWRVRS